MSFMYINTDKQHRSVDVYTVCSTCGWYLLSNSDVYSSSLTIKPLKSIGDNLLMSLNIKTYGV